MSKKSKLTCCCKECINIQKKEYHHKNRTNILKAKKKHYQKNRAEILLKKQEYRCKNIEKCRERLRNYYKNNKLKYIEKKQKREKNYGFNKIHENVVDEPVHWHHTNDDDVVAIPADIHVLYYNNNKEIHREELQYIINQIYETHEIQFHVEQTKII